MSRSSKPIHFFRYDTISGHLTLNLLFLALNVALNFIKMKINQVGTGFRDGDCVPVLSRNSNCSTS